MFYDNFLRACNSAGKKPSSVLLEIGLGKSAGTRWKRGEMPTDASLQKLADYFNISKAELVGTGNKKQSAPLTEDELLNKIQELNAENQKKAREYIAMLRALQDRQ